MSRVNNAVEPASLLDLAIETVCANPAKSICVEVGNTMKLREGVSLPLNIASNIFNHLIKSLNVDPMQPQSKSDKLLKYCSLFTDSDRCKLHNLVLQRAPITDDVVQVLLDLATVHSISEIDISGSSDMKADYRADSAPYNHSIFIIRFLVDACGSTLKRLIMSHALFANSIQQISSLSGKKARVLKQDQYLASDATIEDMPFILSSSNAPKLEALDVSGSFTAWFIGIDPSAPPPLRSLSANGYNDKLMNPSLKEILRNIAFGEPDYPVPARMPATIAYPKSERKMHKYRFFKKFGDNLSVHERFVECCKVQEYIIEDDRLEADRELPVSGNSIMNHISLLSMKRTLRCLSLFRTYLSVRDLEEEIFQLENLIQLDLGWPERQTQKLSKHRPSDITIWRILDAFPLLQSLDISGTSWAQVLYDEAEHGDGGKIVKMDRQRVPLDFLGLWGTHASKLKNIHALATNISGDETVDQLVTCMELYMHSSKIISDVLSTMSDLLPDSPYEDRPEQLLNLLIRCVKRNRVNSTLLFECTACIYYHLQTCNLNWSLKHQLVEALVIIMENNMRNGYVQNSLLRNTMTLFFQPCFKIPHDVLFDFDRIASLCLEIFKKHKDAPEVAIVAGSLCNTLVCSVETDVKMHVRKHSYIDTMIEIIQDRYNKSVGDDVLDVAWSALWNVTDETPSNSEDFVKKGGLALFKNCYEAFPEQNELHRNMTGLLGNISEVPHLRALLATEELVNIYCSLTMIPGSEIETGYNACGILSNLLVEKADILQGLDRAMLREHIRKAISSWDVDVARNINYRTFEPLLAILKCPTEPEAHLWVLWALHNLCQRDGKYVEMVIKEDGMALISVIKNMTEDDKLISLASSILRCCEQRLSYSA